MLDFNKVILRFSNSPTDVWTVDDAMKGTSIIGGTGSGKTTASGKTIAKQFLKEGWGGLVLCAKADEADLWRQYCRETGREDDLLVFGNNSSYHPGTNRETTIAFNPIQYERLRNAEGDVEILNLTNMFMNIYRMGNRISGEGEHKEERFWDTALKRCISKVFELLTLSGQDLSYSNMTKLINSTNELNGDSLSNVIMASRDGMPSALNQSSHFCLFCLYTAYTKHIAGDKAPAHIKYTFDDVADYFTEHLQSLGDKVKPAIIESFMGLAEPFLSGMLARHFAGQTNIFPEWTFQYKKIIVLDFPIKEYLDSGIIAQCVFKLSFQQAVERRNVSQHPTPVFLWCDEAQYFTNPYDQIFLTTARSSRTATVFLSQNLSNYYAAMGGEHSAPRVNSLMGNLSTKIFHANSDAVTNEYASTMIGQTISFISSSGSSSSLFNLNFGTSKGMSMSVMPQVQPKEFITLKTGGSNNGFEVGAVVLVTGKQWSDGSNFLRTVFKQNFNT